MTTTINISLPTSMYEDAKKMLTRYGYASISEFFRNALRDQLYPKVAGDEFTAEFEEQILRSEAEPVEKDIVLETDKDIEDYFLRLKRPRKKTVYRKRT